jgi:WD40 repeat protein
VVTGGEDKFVRLWDMATGNKLAEHSLHLHSLISVDISTDGLWARTISKPQLLGRRSESTALYWNLKNHEVSKQRPPKSYYQNDVITYDKTVEFKRSYETIQVFDALRQKLLYSFKAHPRTIGKIKITNDNQYLISIADDQGMLVWAAQEIINSPQKVELYNYLMPHNDEVSSTAITSDVKYGVIASWDGTITIWNMDSKTVRHRFKQLGEKSNYVTAITPDDQAVIAGGKDGAMCAWNIETGRVVGMFGYRPLPQQSRHQENIQTIAVHPSSSVPLLASGSGNDLYGFIGSGRGELKLWNYFKSTHIADLYIGDEQIKRTLFSPKGNICVFATGFTLTSVERDKRSSTLFIADIEQGRINKIKLDFKAVGDIVFSSDGRFLGVSEGSLLAHGKDKPIALIFHTDTWQISHKCFLDDASGYVESLRFANNCTILFGGIKGGLTDDNGCIFGWDISQSISEEIKPFYTYIGHSGDVRQIELTSDDHYLISTADDQTIRLWSLQHMQELAIFQIDSQIQHFSLATDNRTILMGDADGRVHIFKIHV